MAPELFVRRLDRTSLFLFGFSRSYSFFFGSWDLRGGG